MRSKADDTEPTASLYTSPEGVASIDESIVDSSGQFQFFLYAAGSIRYNWGRPETGSWLVVNITIRKSSCFALHNTSIKQALRNYIP